MTKALTVFTVVAALYLGTMFPSSAFNEQTRTAFAFIHGTVEIDAPDSYIEHADFHGHKYALHPPLGAVLMIPSVLAQGMNANQTIVCSLMGAVGVMLVWILTGQLALTILFAVGSIWWYWATLGDTWSFPIVLGTTFILAMLVELKGLARPAVLGLWAALACLSRYEIALVVPIIALLAWRRRNWREMLWMGPPLLAALVVFVAYNEVRYGTWFDVGLNYIPNVSHRWTASEYFYTNIRTWLWLPPKIDSTFPYLHPTFIGQGILWTSPAFFLVLRAPRTLENLAMAVAALLLATPFLFLSCNGFSQFGARYYIPTYPFILAILSTVPCGWAMKGLIVLSVVLVGSGLWQIHRVGLVAPW